MVDGGSADFNVNPVNAATFTVTGITGNAVAGNSIYTDGGAGTRDGFGSFNGSIDLGNSSPDHRSTLISFTLTNTSGTWASQTSVLGANADGNFIAAHIGVCNVVGGCTSSGTDLLATGFADDNVPGVPTQQGAVPEASTWAMMILGFVGVGFMAYRRKDGGTFRIV